MNVSTCLSTYLSPVVPGRCSQWRSRMSIRVARARLTHTAHHPSKQTINHSLTISNQSLMINRQLIPNIKSRTIYIGQSINSTNTQSTIYHEQSLVRHNLYIQQPIIDQLINQSKSFLDVQHLYSVPFPSFTQSINDSLTFITFQDAIPSP